MSIYKKYKQNKSLESEGITFQVGDAKFLVRRYDVKVPEVRAAYEKAIKPYVKKIKANLVEAEEAMDIEREMFVKTCVIGWEDVVNENGESIPFSVSNAIELFKDLPDLYTDLKNYASDRENYKEDYDEHKEDLGEH